MTHLIDKLNSISMQSVSAGAIIDSKGKQQGSIRIRFTKSMIGCNHRGQVLLFGTDSETVEFNGNNYNQPIAMIEALNSIGLDVYDHGTEVLNAKQSVISQFNDIKYIKVNDELLTIIWVI